MAWLESVGEQVLRAGLWCHVHRQVRIALSDLDLPLKCHSLYAFIPHMIALHSTIVYKYVLHDWPWQELTTIV